MEAMSIAGRRIGPADPPYIIAEIGANHNGDVDLCLRLVDAARDCGADAVKFQSWSRDSLISRAEYRRNVQYARDPLAQETLEAEDFHWLGESMRKLGVPVFSVLEGGYSSDLPELILAYLKGLNGG